MSADQPTTEPTAIPERVLALFAQLFRMEEAERLPLASLLRQDIGLDSLDIIELGIALDEAFGISISDQDVQSWEIVLDVVGTVERLVARKAS